MKCPHCLVEFHASKVPISAGQDKDGYWGFEKYECPNPECSKLILYLVVGNSEWHLGQVFNRILILTVAHISSQNRQRILGGFSSRLYTF